LLTPRSGICTGQHMRRPLTTTGTESELGRKDLARHHDTLRPERRCPSTRLRTRCRRGVLMVLHCTGDGKHNLRRGSWKELHHSRFTCIRTAHDFGDVPWFRIRTAYPCVVAVRDVFLRNAVRSREMHSLCVATPSAQAKVLTIAPVQHRVYACAHEAHRRVDSKNQSQGTKSLAPEKPSLLSQPCCLCLESKGREVVAASARFSSSWFEPTPTRQKLLLGEAMTCRSSRTPFRCS
jgi:hypothetical protein